VETFGCVGSTSHEPGTLIDALLDVPTHPVPLCGGNERPDLRVTVAWADGDALGRRLGQRDALVLLAPGYEHARERRARLARVEVAPEDHTGRDARVQVGVVEDDVGRLAT